jgi:hypothetical protein
MGFLLDSVEKVKVPLLKFFSLLHRACYKENSYVWLNANTKTVSA